MDELRHELQGLSGPERAARIVGARNAADEVMGASVRGDTTLRNKFLAPNNQEKLRLLIGDRRAKDLIDTLEQQSYLSGQAKYVNPRAGSPTAPRTAAMNALEAPPLPDRNPNLTQPLSFIPAKFRSCSSAFDNPARRPTGSLRQRAAANRPGIAFAGAGHECFARSYWPGSRQSRGCGPTWCAIRHGADSSPHWPRHECHPSARQFQHRCFGTGSAVKKAAATKKGKWGREETFTQEVADKICDLLAGGKTLTKICKTKGMPSIRTVQRWCQRHADLSCSIGAPASCLPPA